MLGVSRSLCLYGNVMPFESAAWVNLAGFEGSPVLHPTLVAHAGIRGKKAGDHQSAYIGSESLKSSLGCLAAFPQVEITHALSDPPRQIAILTELRRMDHEQLYANAPSATVPMTFRNAGRAHSITRLSVPKSFTLLLP
jgi:hypothetical protein